MKRETRKLTNIYYFIQKSDEREGIQPGKIAKFPKLGKVTPFENYNQVNPPIIEVVGALITRSGREISLFKIFSVHLFAPTRANKNQPSKTTRPVKIFRVQAL